MPAVPTTSTQPSDSIDRAADRASDAALAERVAEWCRTATDDQRQDLELLMIPKHPVPGTFGILGTKDLKKDRAYYFHVGQRGIAAVTAVTAALVASGAWWYRRRRAL
jgi:hypothetical protein